MSKIRQLIGQLPFLAQCIDADRFSERNLMVFDKETEDPDSVFAFRETDKFQNRLATAEIPEEFIINQNVYKYGMERLKVAMLSQDKAEGRITEDQERELKRLTSLDIVEGSEKDAIDDILPMEEAVRGVWS